MIAILSKEICINIRDVYILQQMLKKRNFISKYFKRSLDILLFETVLKQGLLAEIFKRVCRMII